MIDPFHKKIRESLGNAGLQAALDAHVERLSRLRDPAFASLPDYEERRRLAHNLRADMITHLDLYLEKFMIQARQNGFNIHHAQDATQAVQVVLDIARHHKAKLIAKAKSMVSEEIKLNQALEAAGIRVVETDLGEYIVQLRGEPPAHIIAPAVHLNREDVARLFHEKLGMPLTRDVPAMVRLARNTLREVFLKADIGISGVNLAVAETGTLCLVTNEGNGRMVTTLPPVHIALMGMERLVRNMDDLGLMLSLLPRAASRQKISVYVSLLNRPKQTDDPDGPKERHIIILDNGRSLLRRSPLAESLYCIRCGACLNICPVFREIGGHAYVSTQGENGAYPGPIGSVIAPVLFGMKTFGHLSRASTLCGACREACPVDIDLPKLLLRVRSGRGINNLETSGQANAPRLLKTGLGFYTWIAKSPGRFRMAQKWMSFFTRLFSPLSSWIRLPAFTGWGYSKDIPRTAWSSFRARFKPHHRLGTTTAASAFIQNDRSARAASPVPAQIVGLRERFVAELRAIDGQVIICKSDELAEQILSLLRARGVDEIAAWEDKYLPKDLVASLKAMRLRVIAKPEPGTRAGLTGTLAAADTGTLIITGGPGRSLAVSLLPEIYMAILREEDIHANLENTLKLPAIQQASVVALISGPSRTADIEMTMTIGAHGPAEVHVFCLTKGPE